MKFYSSNFNAETGKSIVIFKHDNNTYIGTAQAAEEDMSHLNRFLGCNLAERRAWIKYFMDERRKYKNKLKAIQHLNKDIKNVCGEIDPKIQRRINLCLRDYSAQINFFSEYITSLKKCNKEDTKVRDNLFNKIRTKENKK